MNDDDFTQPQIRFTPIPNKKGYFYTSDGLIAELLWNPWDMLDVKRWQGKFQKSVGPSRPRAYELIAMGKQAEILAGYENGELIESPDFCMWRNEEMTVDNNDVICFSCRYRTCRGCGNVFKAMSKNAVTCSTECANLLSGKRGRWMILERDNFTCAYCGVNSPDDHALLHVDHIVPVNEGGTSRAGNLITACRACNVEKSAKRMTAENETKILDLADGRNKARAIDSQQVIMIREND